MVKMYESPSTEYWAKPISWKRKDLIALKIDPQSVAWKLKKKDELTPLVVRLIHFFI